MSRDFSQARLEALLKRPDTTWRHDVDVDLKAAVKMAELEASLGVSATYYLMPRTPYYNVFSVSGDEAAWTLLRLGHQLGVHCDIGRARGEDVSLVYAGWMLDRDYSLVNADDAGCPFTNSVSFHCPPDSLLWQDIPGYVSAYGPQWKGRYYSDSRGLFAHGDPEDAEGHIQVNLHPEHWFPEHEGFWR